MPKHLVIVESPAKARTIERYLGDDYRVLASYGHVRDLPDNPGKGKFGVDVEHGFTPEYVISEDRRKQVDEGRLLLAIPGTATDRNSGVVELLHEKHDQRKEPEQAGGGALDRSSCPLPLSSRRPDAVVLPGRSPQCSIFGCTGEPCTRR